MAFEIFTGTGTKNADFISVTANKTFGFPRAFIENNHISDTSKVVILYDSVTNRVALYFSPKNPKFGYAFRRSKNKRHGGSVIAHGFFDSKNIDAELYAQRYDYDVVSLAELGVPDKEGDAFVITLKPNKEVTSTSEVNDEGSINLDDIPF